MWPWGHVAVAYLLYTVFTHRQFDRPPRAWPLFALLVGSQAPDMVDKPLGWSLGVLPGGRTLSHSVLFLALLAAAGYALARHYDRLGVATAFLFGYTSHLVADVPPSVLAGDLSGTEYVLWPLTEPAEYESVGGILEGFLRYSMGSYEWLQLGLFALAVVVWYREGRPGLATARLTLRRYAPTGR